MAGVFDITQGAKLLTTWISKKWIPALERDLQISKFTTKVIVPPGMGRVGRVVTFSNAPGSTTALSDGTIGNSVDITTTGSDLTINEYGEYTHIPSINDFAMSSGMREEIVKRFRHGALVSIDGQVNAAAQTMTTNVFVFQNSTAGAAASPLNAAFAANASGIISARKKVKDAFAVGFTGIEGHPDGQFAFICGQQAEVDIVTEATTGRMTWQNSVVNVPGRLGQEKWVNGYMGSIYGTACYTSQNMTTGLSYSASNVTCNFVLADGCLAAMAYQDMDPQIFVNVPGPTSTDNKYRNFISVAWHTLFATKLHDGARGVKIYSLGS